MRVRKIEKQTPQATPQATQQATQQADPEITLGEPWPKTSLEKASAIVERHRSIELPPGIPLPDTNSPTWPFVFAFACAMEYKFSRNRHKGDADGWRQDGANELQDRLDEETDELDEALADFYRRFKTSNESGRERLTLEVLLEAADVGNFAMMVADVARQDSKRLRLTR